MVLEWALVGLYAICCGYHWYQGLFWKGLYWLGAAIITIAVIKGINK